MLVAVGEHAQQGGAVTPPLCSYESATFNTLPCSCCRSLCLLPLIALARPWDEPEDLLERWYRNFVRLVRLELAEEAEAAVAVAAADAADAVRGDMRQGVALGRNSAAARRMDVAQEEQRRRRRRQRRPGMWQLGGALLAAAAAMCLFLAAGRPARRGARHGGSLLQSLAEAHGEALSDPFIWFCS